jgi:methyl-accepting chemotaxis protein
MTRTPSKSTSPDSNNGKTPPAQNLEASHQSTSASANGAYLGDGAVVRSDSNTAIGGQNSKRSLLQQLRFPLKNSLGSRLFFYVLGAALVGLGGMSYLFYQALAERAEGEIQSNVSTKARTIETQLSRVDESVASLATAIKTLHDRKIVDPNTYRELTFDFFLERPDLLMGVGFGQTAYGVSPEVQWFSPYYYVDQNVPDQTGQPLPAPYEGIRYVDLFVDDNYPEQDYFKQGVEAQELIWYEPYKWYGITITTHSGPIFNDAGKLIGVAYVDVNVTAISQQVEESVLRNAGYYTIISEQGNLLAYPPDPVQAEELATYEDIPELREIWQQIGENDAGLLLSQGTYWAYQRIEGTDWLLLAAVPRSVVLGPTLGIVVGGALGAGVILALVVAFFVRRLNQRLQPILDECNKLSRTSADSASQPLDIKGSDEIEILEKSFNHMTAQLRSSFNALEETNRELEQRVEDRTAELKRAKEASEQDKRLLQTNALKLLQEVDPISKGDLTIRAKVTEDEIGTIADSYNATVENLCKIVLQVQQAANQVVTTASNNQSSVEVLSDEAARQAAEIAAALDKIEQLAEAVRAVAQNAAQAEAAVQQANETVAEGDMAMDRAVDGMQSIRVTVAETAKKVKHLGESSQRISTVIDLINAFAAQTNMLALNASIEASRAGEYGKGFAVVAEEVRALARQSADATEEIRKLIVGIQAETNDVVKAMETGTEQVVVGTKLVDETRQSLNRISATSAQISRLVEAIAQATVVQAQVSGTVTQTMQDVAAIADKTSIEAKQVSSSFGELREVAETLQAEVSQFRL